MLSGDADFASKIVHSHGAGCSCRRLIAKLELKFGLNYIVSEQMGSAVQDTRSTCLSCLAGGLFD